MRPSIPASLTHSLTQLSRSISQRRPNSAVRLDAQSQFKTYPPVTPSLRHVRLPYTPELHKGKPMRHLTEAKRGTGGRNNLGRVTARHRGGGHKRRIRIISYGHVEGTVERLEYDPNRSAHIALVRRFVHLLKLFPLSSLAHTQRTPTCRNDGASKSDWSYILAPQNLSAGSVVKNFSAGLSSPETSATSSSDMPASLSDTLRRSAALVPGTTLPLHAIPAATPIHAISLRPNAPGLLCRAAGTSATLVNVSGTTAQVRLPSGEVRKLHKDCTAVVGTISNPLHRGTKLGKAGRARWLGRRPHVRGTAMNTVDHPNGGGRGKSKGNKQARSPSGVLAKGFRTRRPGNKGNKMVVKERPRGKKQRN